MKVNPNVSFGATMTAPQPSAETMPEVPPASIPTPTPSIQPEPPVEPSKDNATFSGNNMDADPSVGSESTPSPEPKFSGSYHSPSDVAAIADAIKAMTVDGVKNPLNWIAASSLGIAVHTGFLASMKNFRQLPLLQSIESSLRRVGQTALALNPNQPLEAAEQIIQKEVMSVKKPA